ncbi:pentapeptide repeat-containing protein [Trichocoleus sp. FACHB-591]|uniref:pentapeptide repeat-containing protein n=1 Tax=Trichocoleus sp. FACHB-591 TaxID=2692872 RepID=UPI001688C95A|nr:pentapeptide repeat-containing protein [Trichocoleus sp. FACHB-591]MBD2097666.1 pentapeptide repeat-containing protein [Trichocoleus sp. FACHB-591]
MENSDWGEWDGSQWSNREAENFKRLLEILDRGTDFWNEWRQHNPRTTCDLHGATFKNKDLSKVNFADVNLSSSNFTNACLREANLKNADLSYANLTNADISNANLEGAKLHQVTMPNKVIHGELLNSTLEIHLQHYIPCLNDLRVWYFRARETGRNQDYLDNIQSFAQEFKKGTPNAEQDPTIRNSEIALSAIDIEHLREDESNYKKLISQAVKDAKSILDYRGKDAKINNKKIREYSSIQGSYRLCYFYQKATLEIAEKEKILLCYQLSGQSQLGVQRIHNRLATFLNHEAKHLKPELNRSSNTNLSQTSLKRI